MIKNGSSFESEKRCVPN